MTSDSDLLRQYAENHDEAAFAEVVRRYVNLVYAAALRLLNGDTHLAQDATQAVFTDMGRKADALISHATVAGWLHTSARFHASKIARTESRRHARDQKVFAMSNQTTTMEISWEQLAPLLDDALGQLAEADRDALLLRFFQDKSHKEVGAILGLDENTARMRVARVLEKLRDYFARYGVTTTAALLASTLGTQAASVSAPTTFAATLARESLAGVADTAVVTVKTTGWPAKMALGVAAVVIFATGYSLPIYTRFNNASPLPPKPLAVAASVPATPALGKASTLPAPAAKMNAVSADNPSSTKPASPANGSPDAVPDALLTQQSLADAERNTFDVAGLKTNATIIRVLSRSVNSKQVPYVYLHRWPSYSENGSLVDSGGESLSLNQFSPEDQEIIKKWAQDHALDKAVGAVAPDVQADLDKFDAVSGRRPIVSAGRDVQN